MARTTMKMIARHAGAGTATVERVLNGRGGVRPELVERILASARALDYPKRLPDVHRGVVRIEVLMLRPELSFINRLSRAFERIAGSLDKAISVHRTLMDESDPEAVADRIAHPKHRRSALIVLVPDHPAISAALEAVHSSGTPVVRLVSTREGGGGAYVGIDNRAAGRMAGLLMAGLQRRPGPVIALCHSQFYGVHRARIDGFSEYLEKPPGRHLDFRSTHFMSDDDSEAARVVRDMLDAMPDLAGIYAAGGDHGGTCAVLRRHGAGRVCFIGHELTEQSDAALREGIMAAIIDQAPEAQARRAIDLVLGRLGLIDAPVSTTPIRFVTVTAENL